MSELLLETTETKHGENITMALIAIDHALGDISGRELLSTNEVTDMLLDMRNTLTATSDEVER